MSSNMNIKYKNKTLASFLAFSLGGLGAHRFYLYGIGDRWAWVHIALLPISIYAGFIEALVIGLMSDEKWNITHNINSIRQCESGWILAVVLVLNTGIGAVALIATIARTIDYLYTGGAYG